MNYLSIDTEYSSFYSPDRKKSGELLQISCVPIINGIIQTDKIFNEFCKPLTNVWSDHAEKVHGISKVKSRDAQHPEEAAKKLLEFVQSFDCMFTAIGHNHKGDKNYVERLISDYDNANSWHRAIRHQWKDTKTIASKMKSAVPVKNHKLETLCKFFDIPIEAHKAESDALATAILYDKLNNIEASKHAYIAPLEKLSEVDKIKKYMDMKYVSMGGDGCVFITEYGTGDKEALRIILQEIWNTYGEV